MLCFAMSQWNFSISYWKVSHLMPLFLYDEQVQGYSQGKIKFLNGTVITLILALVPAVQFYSYKKMDAGYRLDLNLTRHDSEVMYVLWIVVLALQILALGYLIDAVRRMYRSTRDIHRDLFWKNERQTFLYIFSVAVLLGILVLYTTKTILLNQKQTIATSPLASAAIMGMQILFFACQLLMLSNLNNIIEKHNSLEMQMFVQGNNSMLKSGGGGLDHRGGIDGSQEQYSWAAREEQMRRTIQLQQAFKECGYSETFTNSFDDS